MHRGAAIAIFAATYVLVSARRLRWLPLGRPVAALAGAAAMVLVAGLSPAEAYAAVDHDTLVLLLGMMGITAYLARAGFFERAGDLLAARCRTPRRLLLGTGLLAGVLSAFLVNDAVCLFLTPVTVSVCHRMRLPYTPFLLAVATSANVGSVATLVGNPQCMILGSMGGLGFADYALRMAPTAAAALAANLLLLDLLHGRALGGAPLPPAPAPAAPREGLGTAVAVTGLVAAGFWSGLPLGWCALGGFALLAVLSREDPGPVVRRIDFGVLLFFAGLFVVVRGLAGTGLFEEFWAALPPQDLSTTGGRAVLSGALAAGSNVVSNVPVVLLAGPKVAALGVDGAGWRLAAMATTFAGNLTLLGSVANIIVAEGARDRHELGFLEYLRFGVPSTLATLAVGVLLA